MTGAKRPAEEITVSRSVIGTIEAESAKAAPEECCGILLGNAGVISAARPARNVAASPETHFEIDPQALVDAHRQARGGELQVIGYYHSHPGGPAAPSATDTAKAAHDGSVWAIAGVGGVAFWRDDEAGFAPLSYAFADG